jgi:type IV secretory pathway TrbL component
MRFGSAHIHRRPLSWLPGAGPPSYQTVELDTRHPLCVGLVLFVPYFLPHGRGVMRNLVSGRVQAIQGTPVGTTVTNGGLAFRCNANQGFSTNNEVLGNASNVVYTLSAQMSAATGATTSGLCSIRNGTTSRYSLGVSSANIPTFAVTHSGSNTLVGSGSYLFDGRGGTPLRVAGVCYATNDRKLFINGRQDASSTIPVSAIASTLNNNIIGQSGASNGRAADFFWKAAWDRALSAAEIEEFHYNPYALLRSD